jgi:hypothetical protein
VIEKRQRRRVGPVFRNPVKQFGITAKNRGRSAILEHIDQLYGGLARIERHDDDALGHQRQIERDPVNTVRRE